MRGKNTTDAQPLRPQPTVKPAPQVEPPKLAATASLPEDPFAREGEKRRIQIGYAKASPRPAAGGSPSDDERVSPKRLKLRLFADKPLIAMIAAALSVALLCVGVYAKIVRHVDKLPTADPSVATTSIATTSTPVAIVASAKDDTAHPLAPSGAVAAADALTVKSATESNADSHSTTLRTQEPRPTTTATPLSQPSATTKPRRPGSGLDDPAPSASHARPPGYDLMEKVF